MQLNPARGRKLASMTDHQARQKITVYAAQPREGTETVLISIVFSLRIFEVYAAQPREGTETMRIMDSQSSDFSQAVYAAQPREGTETHIGVP